MMDIGKKVMISVRKQLIIGLVEAVDSRFVRLSSVTVMNDGVGWQTLMRTGDPGKMYLVHYDADLYLNMARIDDFIIWSHELLNKEV